MARDEQVAGGDPEPEDEAPATPVVSTGRGLKSIAADLWRPRAASTGGGAPVDPKAVVEGLDRRERMLAWFFVLLAFAMSVIVYLAARHDSKLTVRQDAGTYLVAGLIGAVLLLGGALFRRRALLGFATLMVGLELFTSGVPTIGVLFVAFGGWLIVRVMRKQKQDQETKRARRVVATKTAAVRRTGAPAPSKRYTPPGRAAASGRRR